jgi:acyl carrier protein
MDTAPDSIEQFVMSTLAELAHRSRDEVARHTSLLDLGVDSLMISTLVAFIEAEYGRGLTLEQVVALYQAASVQDVLLAIGRPADDAVAALTQADPALA